MPCIIWQRNVQQQSCTTMGSKLVFCIYSKGVGGFCHLIDSVRGMISILCATQTVQQTNVKFECANVLWVCIYFAVFSCISLLFIGEEDRWISQCICCQCQHEKKVQVWLGITNNVYLSSQSKSSLLLSLVSPLLLPIAINKNANENEQICCKHVFPAQLDMYPVVGSCCVLQIFSLRLDFVSCFLCSAACADI